MQSVHHERNVYYFQQKMNPDKYCSSRKSDGSLRQICQTFTNCRRGWDNAPGNQMLHLYRFYASITQLETKTSSTSYVKPCRTFVFLCTQQFRTLCTVFLNKGRLEVLGSLFAIVSTTLGWGHLGNWRPPRFSCQATTCNQHYVAQALALALCM